jgi:Flp pilus assembly protein TadG
MGLAAETSYWYQHKRGMQNAADAAAIAAASGANASSNYNAVAQAVAAQMGFTNGSGNITVTAASTNNATGCPANTNCYTVTISDDVPLFLSKVIGYAGTATVGKNGMTAISASSAAASAKAYPYCILALAGDVTTDLTTNGGPKANLNGCNTMANSNSTCNGHNLNAGVGDAHGTNNGCGIIQNSNVPTEADPYAGLASNIPADNCGGSPPNYPQEATWGIGPPAPSRPNQLPNQLFGSYRLSGNNFVCGDLQLTADTFISAPSNAVLVIENGHLDLNSNLLQTTSGSGLTIVFTSPPADYGNQAYLHYPIPSKNGTLDIAAPTSGTWSGMAIYQDPNLTEPAGGGNLDVTYKGNSPTWDISGMIYLPNSSVTMSGAINKATNGLNCLGMTVDNLLINGTGSIFANDTQCKAAGLALPQGGNRGTLVN